MRETFFVWVLLLLGSFFSTVLAQKADWNDPRTFERNKMTARNVSYSFENLDKALSGNRESSFFKLLDGDWDFRYFAHYSHVPEGFYLYKNKGLFTEKIKVPGNLETQGFGIPIYTNNNYCWKNRSLDFPIDSVNSCGVYSRNIRLEEEWVSPDRELILHFGGVTSAFYVWLNGKRVGYSQGSKTVTEFDVTPFLKIGNNRLVVQVFRFSDGTHLETMDKWRMSGIHRSVYLMSEPKVRINDFAVRTILDKEYRDATLEINPKLKFPFGKKQEDLSVKASLFDSEGKAVGEPVSVSALTIYDPDQPQKRYKRGRYPKFGIISMPVINPEKWSAERPYLYKLVLGLYEGGRLIEARSSEIGFRSVEVSGEGLKVNGKEVVIYGVNRHDHDPVTGNAVTREMMENDVKMMKRFNINAVRTSHYPNDPYFLELCDRYGIYVLSEANIETHAVHGLISNLTDWTPAMFDRIIRMVERDKNHPSIIGWSLGNESGFGPNHFAMSAWVETADPTRFVHYEGSKSAIEFGWKYYDLESWMYPTVERVKAFAEDSTKTHALMMCEYAHSMGNSTGNLKEYYDLIHKHPKLVGGFIWDWLDQSLMKKTAEGDTLWAYGGDFGDTAYPSRGNFLINGLLNPDGKPQGALNECRKVFEPIVLTFDKKKDDLEVYNRHSHISTSKYRFFAELLIDGKRVQRKEIVVPELASGEKRKVPTPIFKRYPNIKGERVLSFSVELARKESWAETGHVIARSEFILERKQAYPELKGKGKVTVKDDSKTLLVSDGKIAVEINKENGFIRQIRKSGKELLKSEVVPSLWRVPTDNDLASGLAKASEIYKNIEKDFVLDKIKKSQEGKILSVECAGVFSSTGIGYSIIYRFGGSGNMEITQSYDFPEKELPALPKVGLRMEFLPVFDRAEYYGKGPHENYPDRSNGAFLGRYETSADGLKWDYVRPQENGNRCATRWLSLKAGKKPILRVSGEHFDFSLWDYDIESLEKAEHINDLKTGQGFTLNLDYKTQGVGGDNSWDCNAKPKEQYLIEAEDMSYTLFFDF
ncbi:beta-galactosidase [Fulvitalea axinellae]|uniref:Beta-galactosidase n=1 Tax=Fulvitalea axinellae TaxID=1182444 RepID=A0AAU9CN55_9BACT|nr:beta-galactosidase [Fulvitalea axinellae]